jgi:prepilin peptidase CpaA
MIGLIFLTVILPALLIVAAISDLSTFRIPNIIPATMLAVFALFLIAMAIGGSALSWNETSLHLLAGVVGLASGIVLFALGWIGGGDAKLFATSCLWLGWDGLLQYAVFTSLMGGILTVAILMLRLVPLPSYLLGQSWLLRLSDRKSGIPYGVALAAAALFVLPGTAIFHLAVAR